MKVILSIISLLAAATIYAQVNISGTILDIHGQPLAGVNVYLQSSYDGASTDENGFYTFMTQRSGPQQLVISFIGFKTIVQDIHLEQSNIALNFKMKESSNSLNAVVITAGSFEASDEKKSVIFKPLDIVTTAGGLADIPSVISTLPGTHTVGEEGKIFVRGGDSYETRTFIDGMIVDEPYGSSVPDIPARGRFSPFLFSGTMFSAGGYSAEYGQALSSALVLQTNDLAPETVTSLSLMSVGLSAGHTHRWKNSSLGFTADYLNLSPYFSLVKQNLNWNRAPGGLGGSVSYRQKSGNNGIIKVYSQFGNETSSLTYPGYADVSRENPVELNNTNVYVNATYRNLHGQKLISNGGVSFSNNHDDMDVAADRITEKTNSFQIRYNLTWLVNNDMNIKFGTDHWYKGFSQEFNGATINLSAENSITDLLSAAFTEAEIKISSRIAARAGIRAEYSSLINKSNIAPRISLAAKSGTSSQMSFAWGTFFQSPTNDYLVFNPNLSYEKAMHYIVNYQFMKNKKTLRIEAYHKNYSNLVKYTSLYNPDKETYNNNGKGYARGIDIFWRDNSHGNIDYWISYSWIDTKRNYRDFPLMATPHFVSDHNLTFVFKNYIPALTTQIGITYKLASGRPYYNPQNPDFMSDRTDIYNDMSLNISYLTNILDHFTIVHFSVSNVLGSDHTFGYRYSLNPDSQGEYSSMAIKPGARRFLFLGIFVSI